MNLCHSVIPKSFIYLGLLLFASIPAFSQRGTFGVDVGQTTDRFGSLPSNNALEGIIDGQFIVLRGSGKEGEPNLVAGGEIRLPEDTSSHARELAGFVGPEFQFGKLALGFHLQIRKIYLPTSDVNGLYFIRSKMLLVELPVIAEYKFGLAKRAFVRGEGIWEFSPHFTNSSSGISPFPNPTLDHGYSLRGSAGYLFPHWYLKATYESRYFKFSPNVGNPSGLFNWRSDQVSGGIGFVF